LPTTPYDRLGLPEELGFRRPRVVLPGVLVIEGPAYKVCGAGVSPAVTAGTAAPQSDQAIAQFCQRFNRRDAINQFPLMVVVDQSEFAAQSLDNFLWTTFTRSDPASDVYGVESFVADKHWGCLGSLVIDARAKPYHAPPLVEDPAVTRRVDALAARGGPLHGII
jgi:4-hydroxy-3-polyprenylbenzoate decarboxylase